MPLLRRNDKTQLLWQWPPKFEDGHYVQVNVWRTRPAILAATNSDDAERLAPALDHLYGLGARSK